MLTDRRTDDGRTDAGVTGILIAHLGAFGSGELKKETQFVKMLRLLHLMTFDPILNSKYDLLVIKNIFSIFFKLITINIQNLA